MLLRFEDIKSVSLGRFNKALRCLTHHLSSFLFGFWTIALY